MADKCPPNIEIELEIEKDIEQDIDIDKKKNNKKKKSSETDIDKLLKEKIEDEDIRNTFYEYIKMRKTIRKPLTTQGVDLAIKKLNKYTSIKEEQILILNNSIFNSWQGLFPLKAEDKKLLQQPKKYKESKISEKEYYKNQRRAKV